jgi:hypothetical protein
VVIKNGDLILLTEPDGRMPRGQESWVYELFTGFSRNDYDEPIRYPVACHPPAWAAGQGEDEHAERGVANG